MIAETTSVVILVLASLSFILTIYRVEGIPKPAKRILQTSMLFFVLWAVLNNSIWTGSREIISNSLRFSLVAFNIAILGLFIFHEYENKEKWYTIRRNKTYITFGGIVSSLVFDPEMLKIIQDHEGSYILQYTVGAGVLQAIFMFLVLITILRRFWKIYQASEYYELGKLNQIGFIVAFGFLLVLPIIIINVILVDPGPYLGKIVAGFTILILALIYSLFPISPVFHQQKLFSLFAIYEGGMPVFRFEFHKDPKTNIADLMVSGALFSGLTLIEDLFDQENPLQSIQFGKRVILLRRVQGLVLALISEFTSSLLKMQLDQFADVLDTYILFDNTDEFDYTLAGDIYEQINKIFLTSNHQPDMKKLYTYPGTIA